MLTFDPERVQLKQLSGKEVELPNDLPKEELPELLGDEEKLDEWIRTHMPLTAQKFAMDSGFPVKIVVDARGAPRRPG